MGMVKGCSLRLILYLHHTGRFSGAENSLLHLVTRLDKKKFVPIFLCPREGEFPRRLVEEGIEVIPQEFGRIRDVMGIIKSFKKIERVSRFRDVSMLHSNGPQTNIPAGLAGRRIGIPVVWHARNLLKPGMIDIDRIAGFLPQKIVCNSEAIRERFRDGRAEKITVTIMNGVDLDDYDISIRGEMIRREFGIPKSACVVGMTSRLGWDKGHLTFLQAVAKLKDRYPDLWALIVGGNVFDEDEWIPGFLKAKAMEFGIADTVVFAGYRRDVPRLYAGMDVFVLATDAEPCGRVIFEAMAMGKPVIGTDNGGTPEIVVDGETGLLFRYGDAKELAEKMACLLDNPAEMVRMGTAGRKRIEEHFTIEKYVEDMEKVYLELVEGEKGVDRS